MGGVLAFMGGAISAGGLLAIQRHTSTMTETVSDFSANLGAGQFTWAFAGAALLMAFICGAAATGALIARARRLRLHWDLAHPLLLEAVLLLLFGLLVASGEVLGERFVPSAALLLCFGLGLQNAVITSISRTETNTTHATGIFTGLGIELGRWMHGGHAREVNDRGAHKEDLGRLALYAMIFSLFVGGDIVGTIAFAIIGFAATVPFAAALVALAIPSMLQDLWAMEDDSKGDLP